MRRISCRAGPTGRATAITIPVSGSSRSATTHSPASRRVTGFPGTCPSPASTASSAGSGAYTLPSGSRANGMAPCRRSAPERIARSSSRSSSPSAVASASRRAFWYGLSCPASGRPLMRVRRAFSSLATTSTRVDISAARSPASAATAWRKARSDPSQV